MADSELTQEDALVGILALLAAERDERAASHPIGSSAIRKTELVLADAGIATPIIARLLNKKPNTVAKTIARARGKGNGES